MIREPRSVPEQPGPARALISGGLVALLLSASPSALAADVSFRQAFDAAVGQDVMVVTVPDSDVLVFDEGSYYTQGKRLIVVAARARLAGETRVGFYPPDSRPPTKSGVAATGSGGAAGANHSCGRSGCPGGIGGLGTTGAPGDGGAAASSFLLDVAELQGDGKLILVAAGQAGGKGQQGGKGGTGGRGGNGAERSCGGLFGLDTRAGPGDGGRGGQAGPGGKGGPGGRGGAGGAITLSANLFQSLVQGNVVIDRQPAPGGPGGEPGAAGDPGGGGSMGGGNSCGGGGSTGGGGATNIAGATGDTGPWGSQGSLRYWLGNEPAAAGSVTLPVKQKLGVAVAPQPKDCVAATPVLLNVKIPDGHVIVQVDSVQVLQLQGVVGFIEPPVMRPVDKLGRYEVATILERQVIPTPQVALGTADSGTPQISLDSSCPALSAQFEASFTVAPTAGSLGTTLAPPTGLKAIP